MDVVAGWQAKDIIVVASSLASLVGAPWLTHIFTRRRIATDKVWNLKLEAYNQIIQVVMEADRSFGMARSILKAALAEPDRIDSTHRAKQEIADGYEKLNRMFDLMNANQLVCSRMVRIVGNAIYYQCVVEREAVGSLAELKTVCDHLTWGGRKLKEHCKDDLGLADRLPRFSWLRSLPERIKYRHWIADIQAQRKDE
jgi:hypothetical protein